MYWRTSHVHMLGAFSMTIVLCVLMSETSRSTDEHTPQAPSSVDTPSALRALANSRIARRAQCAQILKPSRVAWLCTPIHKHRHPIPEQRFLHYVVDKRAPHLWNYRDANVEFRNSPTWKHTQSKDAWARWGQLYMFYNVHITIMEMPAWGRTCMGECCHWLTLKTLVTAYEPHVCSSLESNS